MGYILAVDQGTHASRAAVLDDRGGIVRRHLVPVDLTRPSPERAEQDPDQIATSVADAVDQVLRDLGPAERAALQYCGIATQRSTVLAWRRNGAPVSAAINWQDTRGAPQLAHLRHRIAAIRKLSGLPLSAHYGATKLHWLHQLVGNDPDVRLGPLSSFLLQRLTDGDGVTVDHANAQRMQMLDIHTLEWSPALADWFDVPLDRLPECRPVSSAHGVLTPAQLPVTAVSGDQNAAWFAAGAPAPGTVLVNLGSGAFVLTAQRGHAGIPELLSSVVYSDGAQGQYAAEGTVNGAGNALRWLAERYGIADLHANLPQWLSETVEPPLFLNTVGGLGSPWWREGVAPTFLAQTGSPARLTASVAESILFLVQHNLERIETRATPERLRVTGGLSRIDPLCRKLASLSGYPVERPDDREATLRGIAWLAAGRPDHWQAAGGAQFFAPLPDTALRARYERFSEKLQQYLDTGTHD
ncbi:MAG: FGGY family carbohydrate kinase [Gammaproteobacteria bacterium]|jgi:glycerol kinase